MSSSLLDCSILDNSQAPHSDVILKNWLVNPKGMEQGFHEVDLLQEHLNFWIKMSMPIYLTALIIHSARPINEQDYYQAHESGSSWEWLETIAPCVQILWHLATDVHATLRARQGNHHAALDLTDNMDKLMGSLAHYRVYTEQRDHCFDEDDDGPAPDVISEGYASLS